ncbi:hypothetical protein K4F52_001903 [Lecanicillium sp. MT-2017a]|nr:hypothetical protein K4F52_001903 [Lecanicillium sp. MT-2017a]
MAIRRLIKHSVACRIADSTHRLPSRVTRWADDEIAAFDEENLPPNARKNSSGSDSTANEQQQQQQHAHNTANNNSPAGGSSSSTLPVLQLQLEPTTVLPLKSCLKKRQDYYYRTEKCKRVAFKYSDTLATCMETGHAWRPVENSATSKLLRRSSITKHNTTKVTQVTTAADATSSSQEKQQPEEDAAAENFQLPEGTCESNYTFLPEAVSPAMQALFDEQDRAVEDSNALADKVKAALEMHAAASGALDFALYVTRDGEMLADLAKLAHRYKHVTKIASFRGEERRYALCGYPDAVVPVELYDDCRTSMSGCKLAA